MIGNTENEYNGICKESLERFHEQDVDLSKYFKKEHLTKMNFHERQRLQNIAQNYNVMVYMGLPAIKPDFMKGPLERARSARLLQKQEKMNDSDDDDDDEDWTPDMERKKRLRDEVKPQVVRSKRKRTRRETETNPTMKPAQKKQKKEKEEMKQYEFRERTTQSYMNLEPLDDDAFLFCEDCNKEYDMDCPIHGPLLHIQDKQVPIQGDPDQALHTIPDGLEVKTSSISNAGLGVFALQDIQPRVLYGPYGGVKTTNYETAHTSGYAWQIYKGGKPSHFVDAVDKSQSNWMRYVNCANTESEQNLVAFQYKGEIYYRTFKAVTAGTELLVWYGDDYGKELRALQNQNTFLQPKYINGNEFYPCQFCKISFTNATYCAQHILRKHSRKLSSQSFQSLDRWLLENDKENNRKGHKRESKPTLADNLRKENDTKTSMSINELKSMLCKLCKKLLRNINGLEQQIQSKACEKCVKLFLNNDFDYLIKQSRKNDRCKSELGSNVQLKQKRTIEHTGEKCYKCNICNYATNISVNLKTHMRTHTGEKPFKCNMCDFACNTSGDLKTHMRTHTGEKPFKCNMCDFACNQSGNLETHMRTHTGEKPFKCNMCDFACNQRGNLETHMRTHTGEKPFKCNMCDFACNQSGALKNHMRTHTGEKPFKCNMCDFACNQRGNLETHMRTHTGEKPFKCNMCDFACNQSGALKNHMRTHTGEKPFKCNMCDFACNQSGALKNHMRTHTGEKPFKCNMCDYACNHSGALKNHMRTHTGEKPFKCNMCDYACNHSGALNKHTRTHTGEKPFKCNMCDYACNQSGALKTHMKKKHDVYKV